MKRSTLQLAFIVRFSRCLAGARYPKAVLILIPRGLLHGKGPTPFASGKLRSAAYGNREIGKLPENPFADLSSHFQEIYEQR